MSWFIAGSAWRASRRRTVGGSFLGESSVYAVTDWRDTWNLQRIGVSGS